MGLVVLNLGFDEFEEGGHRGGDPLVLVPEDMSAHVERGTGPVESFQLVLA